MRISLAWEEKFPQGYGHTSISFLKRCPGFEDAKNGDSYAADFVVSRCVKHNRINELIKQYPDTVLLPVLSKNQIPLALAKAIGLPIWYGVHLRSTISRKSLNAMQRFLHKPIFTGYIKKDIDYILIDDVVTQGGTISALREFVLVRGGRVVAVVALSYAIGSHAIAPTKKQIVRLILKFGIPLANLLQILRIANIVRELTYSQAKYLLKFSSIRNIEKRIEQIAA